MGKAKRRIHFLTACVAAAVALWSAGAAQAADKPAEKIEFVPVPGFPQVPAHVTLGKCSAVAVSSSSQVYLLHRGKVPILCFDRDGKFVRGWGDEYVNTPHGLRIDRDDNIWITDIGNHLVLKFSPAGKLLLSLGRVNKPGTDIDQFNKPSDVAFGPGDEVFVSDGYVNTRVMQFNGKGKFVKTWGKPGAGPGEFDLVHAFKVDSRNRILVADRENERIQVFNLDGELLTIWKGFAPYGIDIDRDGVIFVADVVANQIVQLDDTGKIINVWGSPGEKPGQFQAPHMLAVDAAGNLFVAEVDGKRMQKFVRKK
jgi:DNA-binding beta-propeller fold protein YncE